MNYRRYCVGCHGVLGDGEGENAQWIDPKPRNFTLATFKCRSTPSGTLPTDADLYNTVGRGLQSSNMPSWNPAFRSDASRSGRLRKAFLGAMENRKAGNADRDSALSRRDR